MDLTSMKKSLTLERVLLVMVLVLQVALLAAYLDLRRDYRGHLAQPWDVAGTPPATARHETRGAGSYDSSGDDDQDTVNLLPPPPVHEMMAMELQMDHFFEDAMQDFHQFLALSDWDRSWDRVQSSPTLDIREQASEFVVVMSLPPLHSGDVQVLRDGRLLRVVAESRAFTPPRPLIQTIRLPAAVMPGQGLHAGFTNGILRIAVPKAMPGSVN
jgi:HSP20 family molecular chaperone IbpA